MYDNEFFVVDMSSCSSTGEIINSLSLALETLDHSGKRIVLKLNDSNLNQSQLLSIQSLITSYGCILDTIETLNESTARIAENMNIATQKPIEKRVESVASDVSNDGFKQFSLNTEDNNSIALKDVNGLHFEADLDAIKNQQENIDIKSDLRQAGINPQEDFDSIEKQVISQFQNPAENNVLEDNFINQNKVFENQQDNQEEYLDAEKNSIGVYKKAYDENDVTADDWEEVDFYETPTNEPVVSDTKSTTYINQTLRSGQILESEGNVVIIGDCHPGSEVRAIGDITVWGVLSGIAHAGYKGNKNAKVRALKMNAVQLRIANCYSRRPDGTNMPYIIRSSIFTPEEARIVDNEIMLFKINQN